MNNIDFLEEQKSEITNYTIYCKLAKNSKGKNAQTFKKIADKEKNHYNFWKQFTKKDVSPSYLKVFLYMVIFRIFGFIFTIKFIERIEKKLEESHKKLTKKIPSIKKLVKDEQVHEQALIKLISEERLDYVSSMILGLNDALVEITGTLAGLTFALPKTILVGLSGLITGIAASLSMASSGYLSSKAEGKKNPLKASLYTGVTYIIAVILLVTPYFIFKNAYLALATTLIFVLIAVTIYNFYVSIAKEVSFKRQFIEMSLICLIVTGITFLIGLFVKIFLGIEV